MIEPETPATTPDPEADQKSPEQTETAPPDAPQAVPEHYPAAVDKPNRPLPEPSADLHPDVATREPAQTEGWQPASHIGEPDPERVAPRGPIDVTPTADADTNEA